MTHLLVSPNITAESLDADPGDVKAGNSAHFKIRFKRCACRVMAHEHSNEKRAVD